MNKSLTIIIVERLGSLKTLSVKEFQVETLFKKCGFKTPDNFKKQTEWSVTYDKKKYIIQVFGKNQGRANTENKYDFPPPIDTKLFYGSCAIIAKVLQENNTYEYTNLNLTIWNKIYEKLFGGFEDLDATAKEDEEEEDELLFVPKEKKTKDGYLKDGFVVDTSETESDDLYETMSESDDVELNSVGLKNTADEDDDNIEINDIGDELTEEPYEY
jgi:hypothetical protein